MRPLAAARYSKGCVRRRRRRRRGREGGREGGRERKRECVCGSEGRSNGIYGTW